MKTQNTKRQPFLVNTASLTATATAIIVMATSVLSQATIYYVATTADGGSNSNSGTSLATPFLTVQKAMNIAVAGDTVNVRRGNYREEISVSVGGGTSPTSQVTVQAYSGETPVIKGSDVVTGWTQHSGAIWKKTGWAVNSQQVFVDFDTSPQQSLQQLGWPHSSFTTFMYPSPNGTKGLANMTPGTFFWSGSPGNTLYVWLPDSSDPNTHVMEVSTRKRLFFMSKPHIRLLGLKFRHCNASGFGLGNAVEAAATGSVIENCDVQYCDFTGISLGYLVTGAKVLNCIASNNGNSGIQGPGSYGYLVSGCVMANNNYRNFNQQWNAGGLKTTTNAYGTIVGNEVASNNGSGIWADFCASANNLVICDNYVHDNGPTEAGIMVEGGNNSQVFNNVLVSNTRRGIYISASDNTLVYNNTIVRPKGRSAIEMDGMPRTGKTLKNNKIYNNIIYNDSATNPTYDMYLRVDNGTDIVGNMSDFNCFYRTTGPLVLQAAAPYSTVAAWHAANPNWDGHSISANPAFLVGADDDWTTANNSPVVDAGTNLALVSTDYFENARPQGITDMGAFETSNGTVAYWPMNEGSGTIAYDECGNNITEVFAAGTSATWVAGRVGASALQFPGTTNGFLRSGSTGQANLNVSNMTIMGWFNHSSTGGDGTVGIDKVGSYRLCVIENNAGASRWQFFVTDSNGVTHQAQSTASYSNNAWHHVAGTFNGSSMVLYVDGVAAATTNWTGTIKANAAGLDIGRRDAIARYYCGSIDSVKILNRAMSAPEISNEYLFPN